MSGEAGVGYAAATTVAQGSSSSRTIGWVPGPTASPRATSDAARAIRHARAARHAARAAADAVALVQASAERAGMHLPDDDVTRVARAAAEIARGLAAGPGAAPIVQLLLEPWATVGVAA